MKKFFIPALLAAAVLASSPAFCATEIDRIVAVVGENVVTLSELQTEMAPALDELEKRFRGDDLARAKDRLRRATLNNLIDKYLQLNEAKVQGIEVTPDEVNSAISDIIKKNRMDMDGFAAALAGEGYTVEDYKKVLADQLAIIRLVNRAVKSRITVKDEDVVKYYEQNKDRFEQPESVKVANIMFPAPEGDMDKALKNAEAARAELMAGTPFEEMAAKCTGDPGASKTCVLGTFGRGELSPDIEKLAFQLNAGDVSQPIPVENGYQLIKVMERAGRGLKPFEEVRPQIVDELSSRQGEAMFAKWVQDLRKHTYVEIRY